MNARIPLALLLLWLGSPLPAAEADRQGLIDKLHHANPVLRREAAQSLGELADSRALDPLLTILRDPDAEVRRKAATALGAFSESRAVAALIGALGDNDSSVQWAASEALGGIGEPALAALVGAMVLIGYRSGRAPCMRSARFRAP